MEKYDGKNITIFVDADACPVKEEIASVAKKYKIPVCFIASYAHVGKKDDGNSWVFVDQEKESVDLYIFNNSKKHDIIITQDIGLAGMLLKKCTHVLSPRGMLFTEDTIDSVLHLRYISARERRNGNYIKGPKKFQDKDRHHFITAFEKILSNYAGNFKIHIE
ncbi:YaiI/YqxD family protein [Aeribacillus sp. FSL K6-1121]|uniref:YaiI/YqxD family protein n=1 Tax=Aeribacillus sp. FSL K6-1121 TaxID=2954745 RepID=UPI0030FC20D7